MVAKEFARYIIIKGRKACNHIEFIARLPAGKALMHLIGTVIMVAARRLLLFRNVIVGTEKARIETVFPTTRRGKLYIRVNIKSSGSVFIHCSTSGCQSTKGLVNSGQVIVAGLPEKECLRAAHLSIDIEPQHPSRIVSRLISQIGITADSAAEVPLKVGVFCIPCTAEHHAKVSKLARMADIASLKLRLLLAPPLALLKFWIAIHTIENGNFGLRSAGSIACAEMYHTIECR